MSLCPHGYTENWDCPFCECPCGSGLPCDQCDCQGDPSNVIESAAPQVPASPSSRLEASPAVVADPDDLLGRFAELVLAVNAARLVA